MEVGEISQITFDGSYSDTQPNWSPDGQWIVFSRKRVGEDNADIWILSSNEKEPINLTNTPDINETQPVWRPLISTTGILEPMLDKTNIESVINWLTYLWVEF